MDLYEYKVEANIPYEILNEFWISATLLSCSNGSNTTGKTYFDLKKQAWNNGGFINSRLPDLDVSSSLVFLVLEFYGNNWEIIRISYSIIILRICHHMNWER